MPRTYFFPFTRDDDTEVTIEYATTGGAPATYDDPEEPVEFEILATWLEADGTPITLTPTESDRALNEIAEHHEPDTGPDPDDLRDAEFDRQLNEHNRQ